MVMGDRLTDFEDRLTAMETSHNDLAAAFADFKLGISEKLDTIETFVGGYNTIAGLAKKHWKTGLIFGAGVMSSLGIGNPKLLTFITTFFGG